MASYFAQDFPKQHVWAVLRIFSERDHRDEFVGGRVRFNTLRTFRELEAADTVRGDAWEGLAAAFQPREVQVTINGQEIRAQGLISPVRYYPPAVDEWNVCSFVALHWQADQPFEENELADILDQLRLPDSLRTFGEYVAVVRDATPFFDTLTQRIRDQGMRARYGLVHYYDEGSVSGIVTPERVGFFKRRDLYRHQRELRVLIERENPKHDCLYIDMTDVPDLAIGTTIDDFNAKINLSIIRHPEETR